MKTMRAALAVCCCLAALHAYAQTHSPEQEAYYSDPRRAKMFGDVSFQLENSLRFLAETAEKFRYKYPDSRLPIKFTRLAADIQAEMTRYEDQLQRENLSSEERAAKLRKRFRTLLRRLYELKPEPNYKLYLHERDGKIEMRFREKRRNGSRHKSSASGNTLLTLLLREVSSDDSFTAQLNDALDDLDKVSEATEKELESASRAMIPPTASTGLLVRGPDRFFGPRDVERILYDIKYELAKDDLLLAEQNLPPNERAAKLRKRFLDLAEGFYELEPYVEYEEASLRVNYSDYESKPVIAGGKRIGFDFPPTLTALLEALPAAQKRAAARRMRANLILAGAALLVLLLLGGVYFAMKFSGKGEDEAGDLIR